MKQTVIIMSSKELARIPNAIKHYANFIFEVQEGSGLYSDEAVTVKKDRTGEMVNRNLSYSGMVGVLRKIMFEPARPNVIGDF